jgi:hypothetical protein
LGDVGGRMVGEMAVVVGTGNLNHALSHYTGDAMQASSQKGCLLPLIDHWRLFGWLDGYSCGQRTNACIGMEEE